VLWGWCPAGGYPKIGSLSVGQGPWLSAADFPIVYIHVNFAVATGSSSSSSLPSRQATNKLSVGSGLLLV
jgi:hypothetical protein